MKYFKVTPIFVTIILIASILGGVYANTTIQPLNNVVYVSVAGNDFNNGLTEATSKRTIQNAINTVTDGGTVFVKQGIYKESVYINKNLNLIGENRENTIIQGTPTKISMYTEGCCVTFTKFTLSKGNLNDYGNLSIYDSTVRYLANYGSSTIINSTITGKLPGYSGGGIYNHRTGVLTVQGSSITDCTLFNYGTGRPGGIDNEEGTISVRNSIIARNHGTGNGGGISNKKGTLTLMDSVIANNTATGNGGGIYNTGTLNISNSQITGNKADTNGGGVYSDSTLSFIYDSVFKDNEAVYGAGIYNLNGMLYLEGLEIKKNNANYGGGIYNSQNSVLNIRNSQIHNNWAWYKGGGIYNEDLIYIDKLTKMAGNRWYDISGEPLRSLETGNILKNMKGYN